MRLRINTYTDANVTLSLLDQNSYLRFNNAETQIVTIPASSNVNFPVNTQICGVQAGDGALVFESENGVIVNSKSLTSPGKNSHFILIKYDIDGWDLFFI